MKYGCMIIADVHQNMLEGIRGLLEDIFEAVIMVADIESLLEAAHRINPDLVLLDLSISARHGANPVKRFSTTFPETKLIVMSVHDDTITAEKIIQSGASAFVLKRSVATDLITTIEAVLP